MKFSRRNVLTKTDVKDENLTKDTCTELQKRYDTKLDDYVIGACIYDAKIEMFERIFRNLYGDKYFDESLDEYVKEHIKRAEEHRK